MTNVLRIYFDGIEAGVEPTDKWRIDDVSGNIITRAYDVFKIEWKRNWHRDGHIYVTLPCVLLGARYKHAEIEAILNIWGHASAPSREEVEERIKISASKKNLPSSSVGGVLPDAKNNARVIGRGLGIDVKRMASIIAESLMAGLNADDADADTDDGAMIMG